MSDDKSVSCNMYSIGNVVVPANSSIVFSAHLGMTKDTSYGIVQASESLPGGLMMPVALVEANSCNRIKLQVTNLSERPIEIPR